MRASSKKWLTVATVLTVVGIIIFVGGASAMHFHFDGLSTQEFQTKTYELQEDFDSIDIDVETATVTLLPSDDGRCRVECQEEARLTHEVSVRNGTLTIETVNNRKWYDYINISLRSPSVKVYLPKDAYASLCVTTKTGNVKVPAGFRFESVNLTGTTANLACEAVVSQSVAMETTTGKITLGSQETKSVKLQSTTGNIALTDIVCDQLAAKSTTGRVSLKGVIARQSMEIKTTTGDVRFDGCDGGQIAVKTSTGSVKGTLLSEKIYITDTSTGKITVPKTSTGGKCKITTSTGSIEIRQINSEK